jgi:hypothetical protein
LARPWENWTPRHSKYDRIARALHDDGRKVVARDDAGVNGKTLGTVTDYDCGCRRSWTVDLRTHVEAESVLPCATHRNLLTAWSADPTVPEASTEAKQEASGGR